jgi:hypothetical protein
LSKLANFDGVEVDLRQWENHLIVQHDAFIGGERFSEWVKYLTNQFVILNIKSEGIEDEAVRILLEARPNIRYFLLDQSFPFMVKSIIKGEVTSAARVSDLEGLDFASKVKPPWVWVDCHLGDWTFLLEAIPRLQEHQIQSCLASPDLHNRKIKQEELQIRKIIEKLDYEFSAVCTKDINMW